MFVQKVPHIKDQFLTQERASMELESGQIAVGWYTNEQDSQSVVHSHPYYELVLPLVGSNVRYSVDGNIYDINLGEISSSLPGAIMRACSISRIRFLNV